MSATDADLSALAARINAMSPAGRLRLAAGLLEAKGAQIALPILERVTGELRMALMLNDREKKRTR